jgi:hypothetical protein
VDGNSEFRIPNSELESGMPSSQDSIVLFAPGHLRDVGLGELLGICKAELARDLLDVAANEDRGGKLGKVLGLDPREDGDADLGFSADVVQVDPGLQPVVAEEGPGIGAPIWRWTGRGLRPDSRCWI